MCVMSMITDHYMQRWPMPTAFPPFVWPDYQELLRKAAEYDRLTGQRDCPAPDKVQWQQELERIMRERYGLTPSGAATVLTVNVTSNLTDGTSAVKGALAGLATGLPRRG